MLVAVAALAVVLTACADAPEEAAEPDASAAPSGTPADFSLEPVRIGFISQEKELLSIGEARVAAEAGVDYVNAELSGVDGHPVELEVCLAGDSPESAVACAERLINDDSILMAITATYSDPAVLRLASKSGLPVITTNTTPNDWQVPSAWAFDAGVASLVQGAATFLRDSEEASTAVLLCADDPGIMELCDFGSFVFGEAGVDVKSIVPVSLDQADATGTVAAAGIEDVDAVGLVLDRSQCLPVAEALDLAAVDRPVLSFDACLRPETIESGQVDGWYEMVASGLATEGADDPGIDEGQRILETYSADDPYPYGFAPYGLAGAVGGSMALAAVPYEDLTRKTADAALGELSEDFGWYPPIECPGPEPFSGACVRQVSVVQADGDALVLADSIDIDVSAFEALL